MDSKKWYVGALLALVAAGALYWYFTRPTAPLYIEEAEAPSGRSLVGTSGDTDPYDVVITFSDQGYSPREVTISKGQRVRFVNESLSPTWPASAIHPTHSLYPGKEESDCLGSAFDACKGIQQGEFYAFTFQYAGEWRFHDHLDASKTGVITVEE